MVSIHSKSLRSRWIACFSLAVFETLVGLALLGLSVAHFALSNFLVQQNIDACHDSTMGSVLQGISLVVAGSVGISTYANFLPESTSATSPNIVLVAIHVLFSAIVAFVGNQTSSHGCISLGRGGEKELFGLLVARLVLSYISHIVGGFCAGMALPDLCRGFRKGSQSSGDEENQKNVYRLMKRLNSQTIETPDKKVTVISLPSSEDGSTIYAVPKDQFVVQDNDGRVTIEGLPVSTGLPVIKEESDNQEETEKLVK